jgi:predicted N-formylglutamate amidohydrolase
LNSVSAPALLGKHDPAPFQVSRGSGASPYLITCDHAGRQLPEALGTLGLSPVELESHIAWDIGAAGMSKRLAAALDAFLILQTYSRLVIDCNRPLGAASSIVQQSEVTVVPGNQRVSTGEAEMRARSIFEPYHDCIQRELEQRECQQRPTIFVAIHSFTPKFMGVARPWHVGVLYNRDARLARALLGLLRRENTLVVGDNEPYSVSDLTDYGIVQYGERRGIPHVLLEVRQDLIADEAGQAAWAIRFAGLFGEVSKTVPR